MGRPEPDAHPAHEEPLVERLINARIRRWLDTAIATELAGYGSVTPEEQAAAAAVKQLRYLALSGFTYSLTPKIVDELRRAGLLAAEKGAEG